MIQVISGFPGVGKSSMPKQIELKGKTYEVVDLESTPYSWMLDDEGDRDRNPEFPFNYTDAIKEHVKQGHLVLVSSHQEVRDALLNEEIPHMVVYPALTLKREYMQRYKNRGNDEAFLKLVAGQWYNWIEELENEGEVELPVDVLYVKIISPDMYLQDIIEMSLN